MGLARCDRNPVVGLASMEFEARIEDVDGVNGGHLGRFLRLVYRAYGGKVRYRGCKRTHGLQQGGDGIHPAWIEAVRSLHGSDGLLSWWAAVFRARLTPG